MHISHWSPGIALLLGLFTTTLQAQQPVVDTAPKATEQETRTAVFAGGCFWCLQPPYDNLDGVISTRVGFTGGKKKNPTYREVSQGGTGHIEAIEVTYNPEQISYAGLLNVFWVNIDPTDDGGQFCDRGPEYQSAIFVQNKTEQTLAENSLQRIKNDRLIRSPIATPVLPASEFYPAEEYHQKYYQKNPIRYKFYRYRCGRDSRLAELWNGAKSLDKL